MGTLVNGIRSSFSSKDFEKTVEHQNLFDWC